MKEYKVVSLFSGGGGLDLGFLKAGFKIVWANDINKDAVATYKRNIGKEITCEDIYSLDEKSIPRCDFVIGGPPCQSFSLAGNRHCEDKRGQLVWRYIDIIKELQPEGFLFENVTGLLSARNQSGQLILGLLIEAFEDIGYTLSWQVVNAADYGVPQLRKRLIIVGLRGARCFTFPETTHNPDGSGGKKKYISVQEALGDLPPAGSSSAYSEHEMPTMSDLDKFICHHVKPGGNYMDIPDSVNSVRIQRLKQTGGHTTCYGRMAPEKPSYTINTNFNRPNVGCNIHYKYDRLITIREALRLQSFPDDYVLESSSKHGKYLIVGNAVPPLLAEVLANQVKKYLD